MEASMVGKKIKISKNRKTYWRKHVNLNEVEEFLEDKRQDERFGGAAADKPDDQLFVVENRQTGKPCSSAKGGQIVLRCFQNLQPDSAVAPPVKPPQLQGVLGRPRVQPTWSQGGKIRKGGKGSQNPRKRKRAAALSKTQYDLWSVQEAGSNEADDSGVDVDYLPTMVTQKTVKVPEYRYQKPSLLPAVETPHPGASYNPTYQDHQALLMLAHGVEVKRQKEEDYLHRSLTSKFPKELPTPEAWLAEMSAGLFDGDDQEKEVEGEEEEEGDSKGQPGPPVMAKTWGQVVSFTSKKTKAERNQEKARKTEKTKISMEKVKKRRLNDLNSLKSLRKQIVKAEALSQVRLEKRERQAAEAMYQPRRLGPCKYAAQDMEVQLGQELPDNLVTAKMEGALLEDRFKSLQRRNLIEPRKRQKAWKKKVKVLLRRTHRD